MGLKIKVPKSEKRIPLSRGKKQPKKGRKRSKGVIKTRKSSFNHNKRFRAIFETAQDCIFIKDRALKYIEVNPAMERLFGLPASKLIGRTDEDLFEKETAAHTREIDSRVLDGETIEEEYTKPVRGTPRTFHIIKVPMRDSSGKIIGLFGIARDITERRLAEKALRESKKRFEDIAQSSADWIWEVDASGKYTFVSGKVKQILGYEPEELIGKTPFELMPEDEAERVGKVFKKIASEKKPIVDLENWNLTRDGKRVCLLTNGVPILDEEGNLQGYRGVDKDITERKRTEEKLRESEERYRTIFAGTQDAMWVVKVKEGGEFIYEDVNPQYCSPDFAGVNREDIVGKRLEDIYKQETADRISRDYKWVVEKKKTLRKEQHLKFPSGWKWHLTTLAPILDENGKVSKIIGSSRDITEMKIAVNNISEVMAAVSEGDLTKKIDVEMTGDYAKIKDSINRTIDNLNVATRRVRDTSDRVASIAQRVASAGAQMNKSTENLALSIQQIAKGAQTQAEKISNTLRLMEGILSAAVDSFNQADEMNKRAKMGADAAAVGVNAAKSVAKRTEAVVETSSKVSETIEALAVSSEEIGKAVEVITSVASQTNILALNAAIEAARAGEQGRGFSVVAEEVRKLAESTKSSAIEIKNIIRGIQENTSEALKAVRTSMEQIMSGRESSVKSIDAIKKIEKTISETLAAAQAVTAASKQQRADIDEVMKEVEEVNIIAEQTSAGTQESLSSAEELTASMEELTSSAQELSTMAKNLQETMDGFKLEEARSPVTAAPLLSEPTSNPGKKKEV